MLKIKNRVNNFFFGQQFNYFSHFKRIHLLLIIHRKIGGGIVGRNVVGQSRLLL